MPIPFSKYTLLGGRVAVDFANTAHSLPESGEVLEDWAGLVEFLEQAQVISRERAAALLAMERGDRQTADALLRKALALRASLAQALSALARGEAVGHGSVVTINELLQVTEGHDELVPEDHGWKLRFVARERQAEWLLAAIARSGAEIISEGGRAMRKCANPACLLLFYDESRNGGRRWCSMTTCGNRSKVAAFARRRSKRGVR